MYRHDQYAKQVETTIKDIEKRANKFSILLNNNIFYPGGGGQLSDNGSLSANGEIYSILNGFKYKREDWILIDKKFNNQDFKIGDTVNVKLNWPRRYINMKLHTASHCIFSIYHNYAKCVKENMEIIEDGKSIFAALSVEGCPNGISELFVKDKLDEMIDRNLSVSCHRFDDYFECIQHIDENSIRGGIINSSPIYIQNIGEIDSCCCSGTHVKSLQEIKDIQVDIHTSGANSIMIKAWFN